MIELTPTSHHSVRQNIHATSAFKLDLKAKLNLGKMKFIATSGDRMSIRGLNIHRVCLLKRWLIEKKKGGGGAHEAQFSYGSRHIEKLFREYEIMLTECNIFVILTPKIISVVFSQN